MDAGVLFGRGISFPPRLGQDGRLAWSEGGDNIREAIRVMLLTEPGERLMRPEFGAALTPLLFEPNTVATRRAIQQRIEGTLQRWEPRIALESVAVDPDPSDPAAAVATITYRLVANQALEQLDLQLQLAR